MGLNNNFEQSLNLDIKKEVENRFDIEDHRFRITPNQREVTPSSKHFLEVCIPDSVFLFSSDTVVNNLVQQEIEKAITEAIFESSGYFLRLKNGLKETSPVGYFVPVLKVYKITNFQIFKPEAEQGYYGECNVLPKYRVSVKINGLLEDFSESDSHLYSRLYRIIQKENQEKKQLEKLKAKYE